MHTHVHTNMHTHKHAHTCIHKHAHTLTCTRTYTEKTLEGTSYTSMHVDSWSEPNSHPLSFRGRALLEVRSLAFCLLMNLYNRAGKPALSQWLHNHSLFHDSG